jgi:xanthine dehydrogenase accessory factor
VVPPPRLFLFGTGHDAVPVAKLAHELGWHVTVCAAQPRFSTRDRFAMADEVIVGAPAEVAGRIARSDRAVAIVMGHDLERDRTNLEMLLHTKVGYIGVLGPRSRTMKLLADLGGTEDARIHAPVGLGIGAETPQEIALAIVAEIQAELTRGPAPGVREHLGAIHDRSSAGSTQTVAAAAALR